RGPATSGPCLVPGGGRRQCADTPWAAASPGRTARRICCRCRGSLARSYSSSLTADSCLPGWPKSAKSAFLLLSLGRKYSTQALSPARPDCLKLPLKCCGTSLTTRTLLRSITPKRATDGRLELRNAGEVRASHGWARPARNEAPGVSGSRERQADLEAAVLLRA